MDTEQEAASANANSPKDKQLTEASHDSPSPIQSIVNENSPPTLSKNNSHSRRGRYALISSIILGAADIGIFNWLFIKTPPSWGYYSVAAGSIGLLSLASIFLLAVPSLKRDGVTKIPALAALILFIFITYSSISQIVTFYSINNFRHL